MSLIIKESWYVLFLGLGFSLLLGCDRPVYYNIPGNKKIKFKTGDTLRFIGDTSTDTLFLYVGDEYRNSDKLYNYEEISINYSIVKNGIQNYWNSMFIIYQDTDGIYPKARHDFFPGIIRDDLTYKETSPYSFNGTSLSDVYHLELDPNHINDSTIVTEIFYSYKYGIVKYRKVDGNYFELKL